MSVRQTIEFETGDSDEENAAVGKLITYAKRLGIVHYARDSFDTDPNGPDPWTKERGHV